jgi:hypothetical protein
MAESTTTVVELSPERLRQIEYVNVEKEIFVHHATDVYKHLTSDGIPPETAEKLTMLWLSIVYTE